MQTTLLPAIVLGPMVCTGQLHCEKATFDEHARASHRTTLPCSLRSDHDALLPVGVRRESERHSDSPLPHRFRAQRLSVVFHSGGVLRRIFPGGISCREADGAYWIQARNSGRPFPVRVGSVAVSACILSAGLWILPLCAVRNGMWPELPGGCLKSVRHHPGTRSELGAATEFCAIVQRRRRSSVSSSRTFADPHGSRIHTGTTRGDERGASAGLSRGTSGQRETSLFGDSRDLCSRGDRDLFHTSSRCGR